VQAGDIIIDVRNGRAIVSVWRAQAGGLAPVAAANADELESDAAAAILAMGGSSTLSGQYPCPAALADRAEWGGRPPKAPAKRTTRKTVTLRQEQVDAIMLLQQGEEEFSTTLQRLLDSHPIVSAVLVAAPARGE
jgi:hypothetical protein